MNKYEERYGEKEDEKTREFHRSRRMFAVKDNTLYVAPKGVDYSHAIWFENIGWIKGNDDSIMKQVSRGIINSDGDIYFYIDYDFKVNEFVDNDVSIVLGDLVKELNLSASSNVFGGQYKDNDGKYKPRKIYGTVGDLLSS